ncbi:MAG: SDR family NAD(P)-dependent oxidoreductase [Acetobacteraceae bacterium]|nr:SDR family NAD(P)-dependent oxidoreductase [Acetobacteraceae bacterium]
MPNVLPRPLHRKRAPEPDRAGVVVITGASSGIGRCTAGLFAQRGWRVGLIARSEVGLQAAQADVKTWGMTAAIAPADVTEPDALEAAAAAIETALGPADVWVNCAGNGTYGRFLDTPPEEFRRVTDVTYIGTANGTRVALRRMMPRDRGCIVNVCSAVAYHGMPLLSSYSGAKHAVRGFDQSIRAELRQEGSRVRITTVLPPSVNTPFFDHAPTYMGLPGRPIPPVYQPEMVAEAIYLAATSRRREMPLSFTTLLFSLAARFTPRLLDRAIRQLGYAGQLTNGEAALVRHEPTLFHASLRASPSHGGFDAEARRGSLHVRLLCWAARFGPSRRRAVTAAAASPPQPAPNTCASRPRVEDSTALASAESRARGLGATATRSLT